MRLKKFLSGLLSLSLGFSVFVGNYGVVLADEQDEEQDQVPSEQVDYAGGPVVMYSSGNPLDDYLSVPERIRICEFENFQAPIKAQFK